MNLLNLLPAKLQPYAKAVVAAIGALAGVAVFYFGDQPDVAAAIQVLTALGVYAQPNGAK
ncbi:DUF7439 family protein [Streptomyces sp. NBC_01198]|uniref:DUF7439 family protein n=1 Tax=Streptomyces sp. NBC_01198 TaxID=2903769 RepID=UPI002E13E7E1|nr:hypothetical protein OG702_31970 [Streptomyces sp. NBC_01198]